jgi:hypothetical protein
MAPRRRRGRGVGARARSGPGRERLRAVLLDFARTVAGAQDRGALVEVIGNLDQWIDRLVSGRGSGEPTTRRGRPRK